MNRQDVANLTFKVVGLYCIIRAIPLLGWVLDLILRCAFGWTGLPQRDFPGPLLLGSTVLAPGLLGALGAYLLVKSRKLAERVFPQAESPAPPARILAIHSLAFSVVGLFVIANSLPQILRVLVWLTLAWKEFMRLGYDQLTHTVVEPLAKLIFGIALFFGSHGLVRIWSRLRYAGVRDKLGICLHCGYDLSGNTSGICPECGTARTIHENG